MKRGRQPPAAERKLVYPGDATARVLLGGLPYSTIPIDTADSGVKVTSALLQEAHNGDSGSPPMCLPDRSLTPHEARYHPDPKPLLVAGPVDAEDDRRHLSRLSQDLQRDVEVFRLGAGHGSDRPRTLTDLVQRGRSAGVVYVSSASHPPAQVAQISLALAGSGIPVIADIGADDDDAAKLRTFLHPSLADAFSADPQALLADELQWGLASVAQRRLAWLHHDLRIQWPSRGPVLSARPLPTMSIVMATRRPDYLSTALAMMSRQRYDTFEAIVVLHGGTPEDARAGGSEARSAGVDCTVLTVDQDVPFGAALNEGVERSSGQLVTKWDDDDLYGPTHLTDLALALRYSGAGLVGKAPEFIHFHDGDRTILRNYNGQEAWSRVMAGGTLAAPHVVLDEVGQFAPLPRSVDHYLKKAIDHIGAGVYRTHGFGFVLERRPDGHTWTPQADEFAHGVIRTWQGIPVEADLDGRYS